MMTNDISYDLYNDSEFVINIEESAWKDLENSINEAINYYYK